MRVFKKIVEFPIKIMLSIAGWIIDLIIKAECWVAGVGFLLLAIFAILAIINQQWLQLGLFAGLAGAGVIMLFMSANIRLGIETILEKIREKRF